MKSWKNKLKETISLQQFKNLWTLYTVKQKNLSAFEAYCSFKELKEKGFELKSEYEKIDRYKEDLKKWGLTS